MCGQLVGLVRTEGVMFLGLSDPGAAGVDVWDNVGWQDVICSDTDQQLTLTFAWFVG